MSVQRRKGQDVIVYPEKEHRDSRGNKVMGPDMENPVEVKAAVIPQRSARAEVPGQVEVDVYRMILPVMPGIGLWTSVRWRGSLWDVAAPPSYHHGTKRVRHYSVDVRERATGEA